MQRVFLQLCVFSLVLVNSMAHAGFVSTSEAHSIQTQAALLSEVRVQLADERVRAHLQNYGVAIADVEARIAAMSPAELVVFSEKLDSAPAAAGVASVVGVVFIVLLVLELMGITDVFTAI